MSDEALIPTNTNRYRKTTSISSSLSSFITSAAVITWITIFIAITSLILTSFAFSYARENDDLLRQLIPAAPQLSTSCPAGETRRQLAYENRASVAYSQYLRAVPCHVNNEDEAELTPEYIGQFTKGMQHDANGVPSASNYQELLTAIANTSPSNFEAISRGFNASRKYVNPQAGLFLHLVGADTASLTMPPAPKFTSNEMGSEYVELAWMALARDVPFDQFGNEPITQAAIVELESLVDYKGIKPVTGSNLFRSPFVGCTIGPYISQFMYMDAYYAKLKISQKLNPPIANKDFMVDWDEFLRVQNGVAPSEILMLNGTERYIITPRDIASYVQKDMNYQAFHIASMILLDMDAPLNPTNPYLQSLNQEGFATFGPQMITSMLAQISRMALDTVWYQKWFVHRRLRPEAYGGYLDRTKNSIQTFPVNGQALNSQAVSDIFTKHGSYLLPQAFPEGNL